jgi:hypothetical protein
MPVNNIIIKCALVNKPKLSTNIFDKIADVISQKNVKNIVIQSETPLEIQIDITKFYTESLTLPDDIKKFSIMPCPADIKMKGINYRGININDYFSQPLYLIDELRIKFIYEAITTKKFLNDEYHNITEKILSLVNADISSVEIFKECLTNALFNRDVSINIRYLPIVNEVYSPEICPELLKTMSEDIFLNKAYNTDNFYNFIKNKPVHYNSSSNAAISNIKRKDVLNKLYPTHAILEHFNQVDDIIKYDKDFILDFIKRDKEEDPFMRVPLKDFDSVLFYFRNNENIVGYFAEKLYAQDYAMKETGNLEDFERFLEIIDKNDKETIFWLAANNINFIQLLSDKERNEYIYSICLSYDKIESIEKDKKYIISSDFNIITIMPHTENGLIELDIKDWCSYSGHYEIIRFEVFRDEEIYCDLLDIINDIENIRNDELTKNDER